MTGSAGRHRLDVAGTTIGFTDRGDGEPVLFIHAGVFAAWFPTVSDDPAMLRFRRVEPVRAGYDSAAPPPAGHLTLADHAAHCAAVLEDIGIGQAHVLAHSSGSLIGLQLAVDRPDLVRSMVLVEPAVAPALLPPEVAAGFGQFARSVMATAVGGDLAGAFDTFLRRVCAEDYRAVLIDALGHDGLRRAERDCGFFFRDEGPAIREWSFTGAAASRIARPVLLVQGGASPPVVHDIVAGLAELLPDARTTTVHGADHLLPLRDPAALAAVAAGFLGEHRIPAEL